MQCPHPEDHAADARRRRPPPERPGTPGRKKSHIQSCVCAAPPPRFMTNPSASLPPLESDAGDLLDVLIVGAGLSGIGAAYHLQEQLPGQALRDRRGARDAIGGTWDLFRYPGRPLRLRHVHARLSLPPVARRQGDRRRPVDPALHPRDRRRGTASPEDPLRPASCGAPNGRRAAACWTVHGERTADRRPRCVRRARFLFVCSGYYRYDEGYRPALRGRSGDFEGRIVTRSSGPRSSTVAAQAVVVIGSGATAVTLVPALAETAGARDDAAALADATSSSLPARGPHRQVAAARPAGARSRTRSRAGRTC